MQGLLKGNGAEMLKGTARFVDAKTLEVETADGVVRVAATSGIIVSTGARVMELPGLKIDGKKVISAKEGVSLNPLPKRLAIIGGGIIGMELGGVYSARRRGDHRRVHAHGARVDGSTSSRRR
ncbi:MAG: FAD-dependent oxidoreductase [Polyangiales bacterium]